MLSTYMRRLPPDIVQFVIIPYTYSLQSKEHLLDIRSFVYELRMIDSIYATQYNYKILLYDLLVFVKEAPCIGKRISSMCVNLRNKLVYDEDRIYGYCRRIWGCLTTTERSRFISKFILDNT